ncbi:MAG TPA: hypothetical protein VFF53_11785, partial [Geobacteraceae bacterium]|nr:hypothetical protein [Geobacteraceae bacterium]
MSTRTVLATILAGVLSTALSITLATAQESAPFLGTGYPPGGLPLNGSASLPSNPALLGPGGHGTAGASRGMILPGGWVGFNPRFPTPASQLPATARTGANAPDQGPGGMSHGIGGMSHGGGGMSHLDVDSPVGSGSLETATNSPLIPFGGNGYAGGMSGPGAIG